MFQFSLPSKKVQLPFSNNKQQILETLESLVGKLNDQMPVRPCPGLPDYVAWALADSADPTRHGLLFDVEVDALAYEAAKCTCIEIHLADDEEEPRSCLTSAGQQAICMRRQKRQNRRYRISHLWPLGYASAEHTGFEAFRRDEKYHSFFRWISRPKQNKRRISAPGTHQSCAAFRHYHQHHRHSRLRDIYRHSDMEEIFDLRLDKTRQYAPLEQMANGNGRRAPYRQRYA